LDITFLRVSISPFARAAYAVLYASVGVASETVADFSATGEAVVFAAFVLALAVFDAFDAVVPLLFAPMLEPHAEKIPTADPTAITAIVVLIVLFICSLKV
jgi:hypothetical protein